MADLLVLLADARGRRRAGVAAYRDAAGDRFPEVAADCFLADVEAATVAWSLTSASRYLDHALDDERAGPPAPNPDRPAPTRQALILHRLARAARSSELPALAELAQALQDVLRRRWGDIPLNYAPAFRGCRTERPVASLPTGGRPARTAAPRPRMRASLRSGACSVGMDSRASPPAGVSASSPSASSTACIAGTPS